ncbi:hypothetical protein LMG28614_00313 [Paraburkholderia ultramafica]|uniref:Uncharacterized protein n=2 Tax=Paraburkholderia ultramafica TaxID=1544867 RepID=A0A6S7AVJ8_9BURK|nr:hypothetical protein LMG28614_00313 [Paraburkholderia ultramafica]
MSRPQAFSRVPIFGTALVNALNALKRKRRQLERLKLPEPVANLDATPSFKRQSIAIRTS